ncbi:hypothetical protein PEDI_37760 [Persicobacter diffluens]|uniref:Uncharacterized protein n=1 Tax=Persicobacter diffluens TaxID=981 RepID=A0AAN4W009_9BACT|nr:hypothetical protein PEDI_37760 [Persicobacter diffluens]
MINNLLTITIVKILNQNISNICSKIINANLKKAKGH